MKEESINHIITDLHSVFDKKKKVSNQYAMIRLFLIAAVVLSLYYGYTYASWFYLLMFLANLLFFWFVHIHMRLKKDIELVEAEIEVYQDILARKQDSWKNFDDTGIDFQNEHTTQAFDLDIYGPASLFQYLCVAKTIRGRELLCHLLSVHQVPHDTIVKRQEAVQELAEKEEFAITLTALLKLFGRHARKKKKQSIEEVYAYMEKEQHVYPVFVKYTMMLMSGVVVAVILLAVLQVVSMRYAMLAAVASLALAMLCVMKNNGLFDSVRALDHMLYDYERIFAAIETEQFHSALLKTCVEQIQDASIAIRRLHHIMTGIQLRNDGITFFIVNSCCLFDFHCVFALERWKRAYGSKLRVWLELLGELESYLSLAQMCYAKEHFCFPEVLHKEDLNIAMEQVYHPLICERQAIPNCLHADPATYIITGSNMSGKTTFLRTIGLNMILFHAGAPVCARSFSASSVNIYTSMRVRDDVSEGISTFYAEILRIKQMIVESKKKEPMLILIDEIFKGTNSADRILCAKEVLRQLHLPWIIAFVSTHDFELCTLSFSSTDKPCNYHFSEYYEKDEICFDYLLKEGRCKTTNARQLLKMAGIDGEFNV